MVRKGCGVAVWLGCGVRLGVGEGASVTVAVLVKVLDGAVVGVCVCGACESGVLPPGVPALETQALRAIRQISKKPINLNFIIAFYQRFAKLTS